MNSITLPVSDLKSTILPALGRVVIRRHSLPVLSTIRVTRTIEGIVTLQGTDLDSHAIYTMAENQPGAPLDMLVAFEPFTKFVKGLGNKEIISLAVDGNDKVQARYQVTGTQLEKDLPSEPVAEFPALPAINQQPIALGADFGVALKQAFQCCSNDPTRQVLNGVCLDSSATNGHYVVGTNGRMLFSANSFTFDLKRPVTVPDTKFLNATDMLDQGCLMAVEPPDKKEQLGWIKLSSPRWTYIVRENIGPFPNYKQVIPLIEKPTATLKLSPAAIEQMLKVLPHLPGDIGPDHKVRLKIEARQLRLEGPDYANEAWQGAVIEDVAIAGKPMAIALNRNYLGTALKFGLSEIRLEDELSAMLFLNGGKKAVIMPVRLNAIDPRKLEPAKTAAPPTTPAPVSTPAPTTNPQPSTQPQPNAGAQTKETEMPKGTSTATTITPPITAPATTAATIKVTQTAASASLTDLIEQIKEAVKNVNRDLNNLIDAVKAQEKQQRATEREVESARATLKKLQQVTI